MKALFIAFFVGACCFLSVCNVRTSSDQEPITEPVELPEEVYVDNIEKDKKAVTFKLDYAEAYKNLGASYLKLGKLDQAIVELTRAIQINPSFIEAHYLLADVYSIKGKGVLSRASLDRAMALEGSYIIDTTIGAMNLTPTIIEPIPSAVIESDGSIIHIFPPEFFEEDVPRRWKPLPK